MRLRDRTAGRLRPAALLFLTAEVDLPVGSQGGPLRLLGSGAGVAPASELPS